MGAEQSLNHFWANILQYRYAHRALSNSNIRYCRRLSQWEILKKKAIRLFAMHAIMFETRYWLRAVRTVYECASNYFEIVTLGIFWILFAKRKKLWVWNGNKWGSHISTETDESKRNESDFSCILRRPFRIKFNVSSFHEWKCDATLN